MNYLPSNYSQEYILMNEYNMLLAHHASGVLTIPSFKSSKEWFGIIFVRHGHYRGGVFKFTISLPEDFPCKICPTVYFPPNLFHPLIDIETGLLDLSVQFPTWDPTNNHIWQLLKCIRNVFYKLDFTSYGRILNEIAENLLTSDEKQFQLMVSNTIETHKPVKPEENDEFSDLHDIDVSGWDNHEFMEKVKDKFIDDPKWSNNQYQGKSGCGFSWLDPETLRIFGTD